MNLWRSHDVLGNKTQAECPPMQAKKEECGYWTDKFEQRALPLSVFWL
jgi:hypothetical protein